MIEMHTAALTALTAAFAALPDTLHSALTEASATLLIAIITYPDRPPTKYVRTYAYRNTYTVTVAPQGATWIATLDTPVPYAIWVRGVYGGRGPAWMNAPYWTDLTELVDGRLPAVREQIKRTIDDLSEFV
jgi:hypothetical protein